MIPGQEKTQAEILGVADCVVDLMVLLCAYVPSIPWDTGALVLSRSPTVGHDVEYALLWHNAEGFGTFCVLRGLSCGGGIDRGAEEVLCT